MKVQRLLTFVDEDDEMKVVIIWRGLPLLNDIMETLQVVHEDVSFLQQIFYRSRIQNPYFIWRTVVHLVFQVGECNTPSCRKFPKHTTDNKMVPRSIENSLCPEKRKARNNPYHSVRSENETHDVNYRQQSNYHWVTVSEVEIMSIIVYFWMYCTSVSDNTLKVHELLRCSSPLHKYCSNACTDQNTLPSGNEPEFSLTVSFLEGGGRCRRNSKPTANWARMWCFKVHRVRSRWSGFKYRRGTGTQRP